MTNSIDNQVPRSLWDYYPTFNSVEEWAMFLAAIPEPISAIENLGYWRKFSGKSWRKYYRCSQGLIVAEIHECDINCYGYLFRLYLDYQSNSPTSGGVLFGYLNDQESALYTQSYCDKWHEDLANLTWPIAATRITPISESRNK